MISRGKKIPFPYLLMLAAALVVVMPACAGIENPIRGDSSSLPQVISVTPRINSAGHFPFSGSLINHHINADLNLFYAHSFYGAFIFKSYDIADPHSDVNYLQPSIFLTVRPEHKFRARFFFGYLFSQTQHFRDAASDYFAATTIYWDFAPQFRLEHTVLLYDYNIETKLANRLLIRWQTEKVGVDLYLWHRMVPDAHSNATSSSIGVTYPMVKLNHTFSLRLTSSYFAYLSREKPGYALRNGVLFTLAVPFDIELD